MVINFLTILVGYRILDRVLFTISVGWEVTFATLDFYAPLFVLDVLSGPQTAYYSNACFNSHTDAT